MLAVIIISTECHGGTAVIMDAIAAAGAVKRVPPVINMCSRPSGTLGDDKDNSAWKKFTQALQIP
jgi:hypothetical protein